MDYHSMEQTLVHKYYRVGAFYVSFSIIPSETQYWFFSILILLLQPPVRGLDYLTFQDLF